MDRPLSPHLTIYRPQLSPTLSILHRMTGAFLVLGLFFLTYWLWSLCDSEEHFIQTQTHVTAWYGMLFLFAWSISLFYHLFNGVRHLLWDIGIGLELSCMRKSGITVVLLAILIPGLIWTYICLGG